MRTVGLVSFLALPVCLRIACAQQAYDAAQIADDAMYDSGLYGHDQEILADIPCPDYTRYATQRQ